MRLSLKLNMQILILLTFGANLFGYTTVTGDVSGQTWISGTYYLSGDISVSEGYALTINPGVAVKFGSNVTLNVYGTLNAQGMSGSKIYFTSVNDNSIGETVVESTGNPASGDWGAIWFYGLSNYDGIGNFDHCIIKYGGGNSSYPANVNFNYSDSGYFKNSESSFSARNGIYSYSCSPEIDNNLFSNNTQHGIYLNGGTPVLTNNEFRDNTLYGGVLADLNTASYSGNSGTENGKNGLMLASCYVTSNQTWSHSPDFPFILGGALTVNDEFILNLAENTVIKGETGGMIYCYGTLNSIASIGNEIVFTSINDDTSGGDTNGDGSSSLPAPGDWYGIWFYALSNYDGIGNFDHSIIKFGGGNSTYPANVNFNYSDAGYFKNSESSYSVRNGIYSYSSSFEIDNNLFSNNTQHGMYLNGGTPVVTNNEFRDNTLYGGVLADLNTASYSGNSGTENGKNGLMLASCYVTSNQTWSHSPDFPFILGGALTVNDEFILNLAENTVIKGETGGMIYCYGTLNSIASIGNEIVFTSINDDTYGGDTNGDGSSSLPAPGDWYGIWFYGLSNYDGIGNFDHSIIKFGGGNSTYPANVNFNYSDAGYFKNSESSYSVRCGVYSYYSSFEIDNNLFSNNTQDGMYLNGGTPVVTNNEFRDNTLYGSEFVDLNTASYSGNSGTGNGKNGIRLVSCYVASNQTWSHSPGFPFILGGALTVNDEITLNLAPGSVFKGESNSYLFVAGNLNSVGTTLNPIIFTSINDDTYGGDTNGDGSSSLPAPGDWDGIYLDGTSTNNGIGNFEYSKVQYGGRTGGYSGNSNIYWNYSDSGYFRNSSVKYSQDLGFRVNACKPEVSNSEFSYNVSCGIYVYNGQTTMSILNNKFENNGNHGLYLTSGTIASVNYNIFNNNNGYGAYLENIGLYSYTGNTGVGNTINGFGIFGGDISAENATWTSGSKSFPFIIVGGDNSSARVLIQKQLLIGANTILKFNQGTYSYMYDNNTGGNVTWNSTGCLWLAGQGTAAYPNESGVFRFQQRFWPQEWIISTYDPGSEFRGGTYVTIDHTGDVLLQYNDPVSVSTELRLTKGNLIKEASGSITMGSASKIVRENGTISFAPSFGASVNLEYTGSSIVTTGYEIPPTNIINNLFMNKTGGLTLDRNVYVNNILYLNYGNITTGANSITLGSSTSNLGTFFRISGIVLGNFKRWFAASTVNNVVFPVGSSSIYRPSVISFTSAPSAGGTVTSSFIASDPGDNGLPLIDGSKTIQDVSSFGYWTVTSGDGLTGGVYTIDADASGFGGISDYLTLHLLKRTSSVSAWTSEGTHQTTTGSNSAPVLHRTGLSAFSEFGVATDTGIFNYGPQNVTIVNISGTSALAWDSVSGAVSYKIYSSSNPYAFFPTAWTTEAEGVTDLTWTDTNATALRKFYIVVAVN